MKLEAQKHFSMHIRDPINRHIRSWVFTPHGQVPQNLKDALRTANEPDESKRIAPDTNQFGTPFGYFPIGKYVFSTSTLLLTRHSSSYDSTHLIIRYRARH